MRAKNIRPRPQNVGHTPLERRSLMQIVHGLSRIAAENAQIANIWTKIPDK